MKAGAFIWLVLLIGGARSFADTVNTVDGKTYYGDASIDSNGTITIAQTGGTQVRVPLSNLFEATFNTPLSVTGTASPGVGANSNWVPSPWVSQNIGSIGVIGNASYYGSQFTVNAAGDDIGEKTDSFHFVNQPLKDDGDVTAHIISIASTNLLAKAGVMLRENLLANGRFAMMSVSPATGVAFIRRLTAGTPAKLTTKPDIQGPCWLKIGRVGNKVTGSVSLDGQKWDVVGTETFQWPATIRMGLAFTGHDDQTLGRAVFGSVNIGYGALPVNVFPRGIVTRTGSVIPGVIQAGNDTSITLLLNHKQYSFSTVDVARMMVNPLPADKTLNLKPGRAGILLATGDFIDGEFKAIEKGRVKVSSVLFGLRTYTLSNEVSAVILRDIASPPTGFEITTRQGTVLQAKSFTIQADSLNATVPSLGTIPIPFADLMILKRKTAPAQPK